MADENMRIPEDLHPDLKAAYEEDVWAQAPFDFCKRWDWKQAVAQESTQLGYWEWCQGQVEEYFQEHSYPA